MTMTRLAKICAAANVTIRAQKTGSKAQYLYLFKWTKVGDQPRRGRTRSVYLCPENKIADLTEARVREKIAELERKLTQLMAEEEAQ